MTLYWCVTDERMYFNFDVIASFLPSLHHVMVGHRQHDDGYMIVIVLYTMHLFTPI